MASFLCRKDDLIDLCQRAVQYILLLESFDSSASALLNVMRTSVDCMIGERENQACRQGRPRIRVEEEQLRFLVESNFRTVDIASLFGCSRRTIERRMQEYGNTHNDFSDLSDSDLDVLVSSVVLLHPQCGEKSVTGRLRSLGYNVQRERVRCSIRRVDPVGVELRARSVLHRRRYQVDSPNSMWHLDGYHKLIRWNIVVHGGIDGFSRLIMYLKASPNNRATSVLSAFTEAIDEFGLPSHVRVDGGGENVLVAQYMLEHPERASQERSVIIGRSVHNQRIERLWRDVYSSCICFFYNFFSFLEDLSLLDCNNPVDLYIIQLVFLPVLQKQLYRSFQGRLGSSFTTN